MLFQQYTSSSADKTYHPSIVNGWKANMEKAYYEEKLHLCFYIPSENI